MIEISEVKAAGNGRIGAQPIALAAAAFVIILIGVGSIALWRAYTGTSPEQDRIAVARQLQARATQAAEQLAERTKAVELSQQETIDQLQILQDQLQAVKRLLAAQQNDNKRLSEQVADLSGAIDGLRESFASARPPEASSPSSPRKRSDRSRPPIKGAHRKAAGARG
jgi:septal ring factor EnvC (AmiA/AmiB activator)